MKYKISDLPSDVQGEYIPDVDLSKMTGFKVGGCADILFKPKNKQDLIYFLKNKIKSIPIFVLGAGYNLLVRDKGIRGVVIYLKDTFKNICLRDEKIVAECGLNNLTFLSFCKKNLIGGYEFLGTIPGTLGGAIRMNAGCYGSFVADNFVSLNAVDFSGKEYNFTKEDCNFEYRKNNLSENLIFIEAAFEAKEKSTLENIEASFKEKMQYRIERHPQGVNTSGSTFKNPKDYPAWKLIGDIGLQNVDFNGAKMSEKHANFMINTGKAKAVDLENLGETIRKKAKEEKDIDLEWEIIRIGEN